MPQRHAHTPLLLSSLAALTCIGAFGDAGARALGVPVGRWRGNTWIVGRLDRSTLRMMLANPGSRLEISDPFPVGRTGRYMCLAKVVGVGVDPDDKVVGLPFSGVDEPTQTLCVISEEGATPEEARRAVLERVGRIYQRGTSLAPPGAVSKPRRGWLGRLISVFAKSDT